MKERATLKQLIADYTAGVDDTPRYFAFVRDVGLQQEEIERLTKLKNRFKAFKHGAIEAGDEHGANVLFHIQCMVNAHISFLRMWVEAKSGKNTEAWSALMDAQDYVSYALRADKNGTGIENFMAHLKKAEDVVFPGFRVFNSCGAVIRGGTCTICSQPFAACDHIEGKVYWGRVCVRVHYDVVELDHVAIVENPRDRRCVITEFTDSDNVRRDYFTWKPLPPAAEPLKPGTIGNMSAILMTTNLLDIT